MLIENNMVSRTDSAGILVYSETSWNTLGVQRVVVRNNILTEVGTNAIKWHPGILIGGQDGYPVENVIIEGNTIVQPSFDGIRVDPFVSFITLTSNSITGVLAGRQAINIAADARPYVRLT